MKESLAVVDLSASSAIQAEAAFDAAKKKAEIYLGVRFPSKAFCGAGELDSFKYLLLE
jgi:hypothetical protein